MKHLTTIFVVATVAALALSLSTGRARADSNVCWHRAMSVPSGAAVTKKLEATAHHEAGHAIAALRLGRPFRYVTIEPDEGSLGHVLFRAWDKRFHPDVNWSPRTEALLRDAIVTALAGLEAQAKFTGRRDFRGARSDYDQAADLASRACGSLKETNAYLAWLCVRTKQIVSVHWGEIRALASALLREKRLSYEGARDVFLNATLER